MRRPVGVALSCAAATPLDPRRRARVRARAGACPGRRGDAGERVAGASLAAALTAAGLYSAPSRCLRPGCGSGRGVGVAGRRPVWRAGPRRAADPAPLRRAAPNSPRAGARQRARGGLAGGPARRRSSVRGRPSAPPLGAGQSARPARRGPGLYRGAARGGLGRFTGAAAARRAGFCSGRYRCSARGARGLAGRARQARHGAISARPGRGRPARHDRARLDAAAPFRAHPSVGDLRYAHQSGGGAGLVSRPRAAACSGPVPARAARTRSAARADRADPRRRLRRAGGVFPADTARPADAESVPAGPERGPARRAAAHLGAGGHGPAARRSRQPARAQRVALSGRGGFAALVSRLLGPARRRDAVCARAGFSARRHGPSRPILVSKRGHHRRGDQPDRGAPGEYAGVAAAVAGAALGGARRAPGPGAAGPCGVAPDPALETAGGDGPVPGRLRVAPGAAPHGGPGPAFSPAAGRAAAAFSRQVAPWRAARPAPARPRFRAR